MLPFHQFSTIIRKKSENVNSKEVLIPLMENLLDITIMSPYYRQKGGRDKNEKNM
jgi:hypothetical protein